LMHTRAQGKGKGTMRCRLSCTPSSSG
jgi:hypothetical protein